MRISTLALLAALAIPPAAAAQQRIGIMVSTLTGTTPGQACGFDCNDPNNTRVVSVVSGSTINVVLFGDANLPAALVVGLGTAIPVCPGIPIPGVQNSLLIVPSNILTAVSAPAPSAAGRTLCPSGGSTSAVSQLQVPPHAAGATLTWQGLVYDQGTPSLTRAIETPIR